MKLFTLNKIQIYLLIFVISIFYYSYYYLPSINKGSIPINSTNKIEKKLIDQAKNKNFFENTEYISKDSKGRIFTTRAKESWFFQDDQGLINLKEVYSFTKIEKDQSLLSIKSDFGFYNKNNSNTTYKGNVIIINKNYKITANSAIHLSEKNLVLIEGNVNMLELNNGPKHSIFCDIVKIDTKTNNAIASMNDKEEEIIVKKFK